MQIVLNRRHMFAGLPALLAGLRARQAHAEPPPEITRFRTSAYPKVSDCVTPFYVAEELLRAEGFIEIEFVQPADDAEAMRLLPQGRVDMESWDAPILLDLLDQGTPLKVIAGMHGGCLELLAGKHVASVKDLRGKRVGINQLNGLTHKLLRLMAANVGLDVERDIIWVTTKNSLQALEAGTIDAFLATPPDPQIAHERQIGHTILDNALDRPWSQYFCCLFDANVDFVSNYPNATKRALRALLKAVDLCASEPQKAAKRSDAKGYASSYDYARRTLTDARYDVWRDYDPEDSLRFYALRMKELGLIASSPNEIIAKGVDWRFLNEIKKEMKT